MSIKTWQAEFYQQPAGDVSVGDAVAHSLRKWRGLTQENLGRHEVRRATFGSIEDAKVRFSINTDTCALCQHFWVDDEDFDGSHDCGECPLAVAREGIPCDDNRAGERLSPYQAWIDDGNPQPMIIWLEKAQSANAGATKVEGSQGESAQESSSLLVPPSASGPSKEKEKP